MTLGAKVIDFVGLSLTNNSCKVRRIGQIPVMQNQITIIDLWILIDVIDTLRVKE